MLGRGGCYGEYVVLRHAHHDAPHVDALLHVAEGFLHLLGLEDGRGVESVDMALLVQLHGLVQQAHHGLLVGDGESRQVDPEIRAVLLEQVHSQLSAAEEVALPNLQHTTTRRDALPRRMQQLAR